MILQRRVRARTFLGAPHPDVFQLRLISAGISGSEVQGALVPSPGRQQALKLEVSLELTPGPDCERGASSGSKGPWCQGCSVGRNFWVLLSSSHFSQSPSIFNYKGTTLLVGAFPCNMWSIQHFNIMSKFITLYKKRRTLPLLPIN